MTRLLPLLVACAACAAGVSAQVTLRLTDWAGLNEMEMTQRALEEFRTLHPHITVLYEPAPGRQYEEKLLTGLAAGDPSDVFLLDSKLVPSFTNKGLLLDLTPFLAPLAIDTTVWFPQALAVARRGNALYAFPKGFTPLVMYYNRRLFREAGLHPPRTGWTWDEYLTLARTLTRDTDGDGRTDVYGTAFTNYYFTWIPWVWSAGGDVVSPDGARATGYLDAPAAAEALRFLTALRTTHRVAPDVGTWAQSERTGANSQMFAAGRIAMIVDGHWRMPAFLEQRRAGTLEVGVAGLPAHPGGGRVNVLYESGWCVPVGGRHPREAALLAAFMAGPSAARIRAAGMLEIPSVMSVAEAAAAQDTTGMLAVFLGEISVARQPWGSILERFTRIEWLLNDAVDEVLVSGRSVEDALASAAPRVDRHLEDIRSHAGLRFTPLREQREVITALLIMAALAVTLAGVLLVRARGRRRRTTATALGFLTPALLHLIVFLITPIAVAAFLSVHQWDIVVAEKPFVGAANFTALLADGEFLRALGTTMLYTLHVPAGMALALAVALILHRRVRALGFLRTLFFLPSVTSLVAIALVWLWIYNPEYGPANTLLRAAGLPPLPWLNSPASALPSLMLFGIWLGLGYQMIIFLAGLQGIPEELYEAARMDGASPVQLFRHLTFPLLMPTTLFVLVTSVIASFQVFTSVYVMTAGGPSGSTDVIVYHIYRAAWEELRMGYASAMAWVLFLIIMLATWLQFRMAGRNVEYA